MSQFKHKWLYSFGGQKPRLRTTELKPRGWWVYIPREPPFSPSFHRPSSLWTHSTFFYPLLVSSSLACIPLSCVRSPEHTGPAWIISTSLRPNPNYTCKTPLPCNIHMGFGIHSVQRFGIILTIMVFQVLLHSQYPLQGWPQSPWVTQV